MLAAKHRSMTAHENSGLCLPNNPSENTVRSLPMSEATCVHHDGGKHRRRRVHKSSESNQRMCLTRYAGKPKFGEGIYNPHPRTA